MEILREGNPTRWTADFECTGEGNGKYGCSSLLRVNTDDLVYYEGTDYPICHVNAVTMKCPKCQKLSDLPVDQWPPRYYELPKFTNAWAKGTVE